MTKQTQIALTTDQTKQLGHKLTAEMVRVDSLKLHANAIMVAIENGVSKAVLTDTVDKFISLVYDQAEVLYKELDEVAFQLLECDNPSELEAFNGKGE